jgi:hypothetical protein
MEALDQAGRDMRRRGEHHRVSLQSQGTIEVHGITLRLRRAVAIRHDVPHGLPQPQDHLIQMAVERFDEFPHPSPRRREQRGGGVAVGG